MIYLYIAVYWLGMLALILVTYNERLKGQMHWKVVMMLFIISFVFPIMVVWHITAKVREHLRDR